MRKKTHLLDQLRMSRENIRAIDALIQGRHGLDKWREIILDWADTKKTDAKSHVESVTLLLVDYIVGNGLSTNPKDLFDTRIPKPLYTELVDRNNWRAVQANNDICFFLQWVFSRRIRPTLGDDLQYFKNPVTQISMKGKATAAKRAYLASTAVSPKTIGDEFVFLGEKSSLYYPWIECAKQWILSINEPDKGVALDALRRLFVNYFDGLDSLLPFEAFFKPANYGLLRPASAEFKFSLAKDQRVFSFAADFLEWVVERKLPKEFATNEARNPFAASRDMGVRKRRISDDKDLMYLVQADPLMEDWRRLAAEWLSLNPKSYAHRIWALSYFFNRYVLAYDLDRNPYAFLRFDNNPPPFFDVYMASKKKGDRNSPSDHDFRIVNLVHDFLQWILDEKLSDFDDSGQRLVPSELRNPIPTLQWRSSSSSESNKSPLPIRFIQQLRSMLAEGPTFRDWKWTQSNDEGSWFTVKPNLIDKTDPNCVWRIKKGHYQLWSPARSVALYIKLELPLRTYQVRMLDSGEADTWRYEQGRFIPNKSRLATGSPNRPYKKGVFYKSNEGGSVDEVGLYVNTNKTADIDKPEDQKGYVIPWTHGPALYWLEALRDWQEKYNPVSAAIPWTDLNQDHFGHAKHEATLAEMGTACFLFRDASSIRLANRNKPLLDNVLDKLWYRLLLRLETEGGHMLPDGTPIRFVSDAPRTRSTFYPLHSLRVSLITYFVLEAGLPIQVVSKLIAGHSRIIMTLYYTKAGISYVNEVLADAERRALARAAESERLFLRDKAYENIAGRYAYISEDAPKAYCNQQSAASAIFEDKGICPVAGQHCDIGGDAFGSGKSGRYLPVAGYPARNCVRCRFFLTGPAFLPGLVAHFNKLSFDVTQLSQRYGSLEASVRNLENQRFEFQKRGEYFPRMGELERLQQRYEAEAEGLNRLMLDMQYCHKLIARSIELGKMESGASELQLVANGTISDLGFALKETTSEMHQIEVICENTVFYPEIDARVAVLRRSHLLDVMFDLNGKPPVFYKLSEEEQHLVGNAVMKLIQARSGSLESAVEFVEGRRKLIELGLIEDDLDAAIKGVSNKEIRKLHQAYLLEARSLDESVEELSDAP